MIYLLKDFVIAIDYWARIFDKNTLQLQRNKVYGLWQRRTGLAFTWPYFLVPGESHSAGPKTYRRREGSKGPVMRVRRGWLITGVLLSSAAVRRPTSNPHCHPEADIPAT